MYVLIAGGGVFGRGLARELVQGRHDVVIIEQQREICEQITSRIGALTVHGSATDIGTVEEAGIRKTDVAVGALPSDAGNLAFAVLARNFDVPKTISRVRNPRYENAYKMAGVDMAVNMSRMFVRQIVMSIEQPEMQQVATFGRGEASIVVASIPEGARVDGKTVSEIAQNRNFPAECVIAGIYREEEGEFVFPRGPAEVRTGDRVFLTARADDIRKAVRVLRKT